MPWDSPVKSLHLEVDAYGRNESGDIMVVGVSDEKGSLPDARVAHDQRFEHVVEIRVDCSVHAFGSSRWWVIHLVQYIC